MGPIVVHGPECEDYDIDLGPIMLSDWYHQDYFELVEQTMAVNSTPVFADSNLINGKMNFDCSLVPEGDETPCVSDAGISKFKFQRGKTHLLRLVNAGSDGLQRFSIDGHKLTVVANDFVPVEPYETEVVTLGIGQRSDVLVEANGELDAYWMRSNISTLCSLANNPDAVAAIYYDDADETEDPVSTPWDIPDPGTCTNDDLNLTEPVMKLPLPEPDLIVEYVVNFFVNETGHRLWSFDDVSFRANYNSPPLLLSILGNHTFEEQWNVKRTRDAKSVRVTVVNNSTIACVQTSPLDS